MQSEVPNAEQIRLHMGELTADEVRIAQAAYRLGAQQARAKLALAEQLLREASPMIDDYSNILYSEYSDYEKSGAAGALSGRIAAAIDGSGETT